MTITLPSLLTHFRRRVPTDPRMWPDAITVHPTSLDSGNSHGTVLLITDLPPQVAPGWLEAITPTGGLGTVSVHITPVSTDKAVTSLRRKRARLEGSRRYSYVHQRLDDPAVDAAAADAADLASRIATGDTRLFTLAVYLLLQAATPDELAERVAGVRAHAAAAGLTVRAASFRQAQGLCTVLPFGIDLVRTGRTVDTDTISAAFPFTTVDAPGDTGILYGHNLIEDGPVLWDRFAQTNHNEVLVARSGAGKSFLTKTELARWAYRGVGCTVIDPDGEYTDLVEHLGGTIIGVGAENVRINPFDIPDSTEPDAFTRRIMFGHTTVATMLGADLSPEEAAVLDTALFDAYAEAGISIDPSTWTRPAPLLRDIHQRLSTLDDHAGRVLAGRLAPYATGAFRGIFDGPSTTVPTGPLVCFNLTALPDELTGIATLLVLDAAWRRATGTPDRHLVYVDEAWRLLTTKAGAGFLARLAKSARKHRAGLSVVTQDAEDMLGSELGRVVIANSATNILLSQAPQTMPLVADAFNLTAAERGFLLAATPGQGLLLSGDTHVAFASTAAEMDESLLVTGEAADRP